MADEEHQAFTEWARANEVRLLRTAYLLCGDRGWAEDLTQEALIKVARRWRRLSDGEPYAYARRIVVNDNISRWRRSRPTMVLTDEREAVGPGQTTDAAVGRRLDLAAALAKLTSKQRAVLVLRYYDDLTESHTAGVLGVSIGTVKSTAHAALRRLRENSPELAELIAEPS